jgi:putative redox protein
LVLIETLVGDPLNQALKMLAQIPLRKASLHLLRSAKQLSIRTASILPLSVRGTGTGAAQSISAGPFKIESDTYKALGGNEAAPSPLVYSLASLGGCQQVTGALVAKDLGIKLGKWEVEVIGLLDTDILVKGTHAVREGEGNWENIDVKVRVETDVSEEKFRFFQEETERRCPLSQLFIRSGVKWNIEWENVKLL